MFGVTTMPFLRLFQSLFDWVTRHGPDVVAPKGKRNEETVPGYSRINHELNAIRSDFNQDPVWW